MSVELKTRKLELLKAKRDYIKYNKLEYYDPYPFQEKFHNSAEKRKALQAGNQIGKTVAGCVHDAFDLTGLYPDWFEGHRFQRPVEIVCGGINNDKTTDLLQKALLGNPIEKEVSLGTGWIPKNCLDQSRLSLKRGVSDAYLRAMVKHCSDATFIPGIKRVRSDRYLKEDGWSSLTLQSYASGKEAWMGDTVDVFHLDEEPPEDILGQAGRGCIASGGFIRCTFTPENGQTKTVLKIKESWDLHTAGWPDVAGCDLDYKVDGETIKFRTVYTRNGKKGHIDEEAIKLAEKDFAPYQMKMRMLGKPVLGSGQVFTYSEDVIKITPLDEIPSSWPRGAAIDFGGTSDGAHPTAYVEGAYDETNDVLYITGGFRAYSKEISEVAGRIIGRRDSNWVPIFWPHDGGKGKNKNDPAGGTVADQYRDYGLPMFHTHFTNPDDEKKDGAGGIRIEPGIVAISGRVSERKIRVYKTFDEWFEEYRNYHQKDGKIVDVDDDLMSATRYLAQMLRHFVKESDVLGYEEPDDDYEDQQRDSVTGY